MILRSIIKEISRSLKNNSNVVGIVVYGSIGREEDDEYSDIDMIIYLKDEHDVKSILGEIMKTLELIENEVIYRFNIRDKYIYVTKRIHIWIELRLHSYKKIEDDIIYIVQSRIIEPEKVVVYDPFKVILPLIKMYWYSMEECDKYRKEIDYLIHSMLYYLKLYIHYSTRRKDSFRAYMNYTISMYKLAGLIAAAYGEVYNLYGPWYLFEKVVTDSKLIKEYYEIAEMYNRNPNENLTKIISILKRLINIARERQHNYVADRLVYLINSINELIC